MTYSSSGQGGAQTMNNGDAALNPEQIRARTAEAFDAGLAFAWTHRKRLCQGGFIAAILEILASYYYHFFRLSPEQNYLVILAQFGATAWLLSYAGIYCLSEFRDIKVSRNILFLRALHSMPKVFISYILLLLLVLVLVQVPLLLFIFGPLFIWAPTFCVTELFALPLKEPEESPDDLFEDDVVYRKVIRFRFFQGRPIWDSGLARSIAFASQNPGLTVQYSLLAWAAAIVPKGAMILLTGYYSSFSSTMIESLATNFLQALLFAASVVSFLLILPQEARTEIGLPPSEELIKRIPREGVPESLKFGMKRVYFFIIAFLALGSTLLSLEWFKHQQTMPKNVKVSVENVQLTKDRFIFTLQLIDDGQLFRWLDPGRLRLELLDESGKPLLSQAGSKVLPEKTGESAEAPAEKPKLIEPERVMPFGVDGTPLDEMNFTPYGRPLRLVLYFAPPAVTSGKFRLYHRSVFGLGEPIAEGEFAPPDAAPSPAEPGKK